jgi:alpha-mannosidase
VEAEYRVGTGSTLVQRISLDALSGRVDFDTTVDWHEEKKFLKCEFPVNARSFNASYEVQFGHVQRPTHTNTSWDMARFEVCGHKWADLSEPDYGVALLTDSKYGYATSGNVMRISLLRAPKSPDHSADMGTHHFRYALYPHGGNLQAGGVVQEGFRFNEPMRLAATDAAEASHSWLQIDNESLIIDTVKKAEDSSHLIVRLYEAHGTRGSARLSSTLPVKSARLCNLLEDNGKELDWQGDAVDFSFTPFQVVTLKLSV